MTETYLNDKGKYSKEYNELVEKLVPKHGEAPTNIGLLLQYCRDLYLEYYVNDQENLYENIGEKRTCYVCDGSGEDEYGCPCPYCKGKGEIYEYNRCITDEFQNRINFIELWSFLVRSDKGKQLKDHISKLHGQLVTDTTTNYPYPIYKNLYERLIDYAMEVILDDEFTELEKALKIGLDSRTKSEERLDLQYKEHQLKTKYDNLVSFLECASVVSTPGVFYKLGLEFGNVGIEQFYINDLGEEAQELWRKFHDKLYESVRDYQLVLKQELDEIEDKIKEVEQ